MLPLLAVKNFSVATFLLNFEFPFLKYLTISIIAVIIKSNCIENVLLKSVFLKNLLGKIV